MSWLSALARPDILTLKPYEHASWEPGLERLHANELPWRAASDLSVAGLNRYPEPQPRVLLERLAALYDVPAANLLVGRGSDEGIDLLVRALCRAGQDSILVCPPTFGMYAVAARIQGAAVRTVPLQADDFALDEEQLLHHCDAGVKLVFLCSPNNPTGNLLAADTVLRLTSALAGRALVVVDEAYVEFSGAPSLARHVGEYPHLVILRTLSKAYGLAGARCGTLIAHPEVIGLLRRIIPPYAIAQLSLEAVVRALEPAALAITRTHIEMLRAERGRLHTALAEHPAVRRVWASDANFITAEFSDPATVLARARGARLLIRDVRSYPGLDSCLRVTVGTAEQNSRLLRALP